MDHSGLNMFSITVINVRQMGDVVVQIYKSVCAPLFPESISDVIKLIALTGVARVYTRILLSPCLPSA
jgi:hypothetical protein